MVGDNGIVWEEPPPARGRSNPHRYWVKQLSPLLERPGAWALVHEAKSSSAASSTAGNIRHRLVAIPFGRWEAVSRDTKVYARFLGLDE